ncbi:MAG: histidine triad nucleotide-binding protein [bacterium]
MDNCLFCKIADKSINANILKETDDIIAFSDINPQSPVHILVIPKKHIASLNDVAGEDCDLLGKINGAIKDLANEKNINATGFRVVVNCGKDAGQAVDHLHFHLLGGRKLNWPPG